MGNVRPSCFMHYRFIAVLVVLFVKVLDFFFVEKYESQGTIKITGEKGRE